MTVEVSRYLPRSTVLDRFDGSKWRVYDVGDTGLVMKEAGNEQSIWFALERLDYLYGICEQSLPPHIRIPEHYGALFSRNLDKQFLLMEKVNNGLTVQDVLNDESEPEKAELVEVLFDSAKPLLDKAIAAHATDDGYPHSLLVDWHEGNVIVDFGKPAGEYPFTLYIIDQ